MNMWLTLAFLFFVGSLAGWFLELFYRHFADPERKWMNPGFCTGPYVPLYGFGLCILFLMGMLEDESWIADPVLNKIVFFLFAAVAMTALEYLAGIICLKLLKVRLWDYSGLPGNLQGIICPQFSLAWALLGAVYYFLVHPYVLGALGWLSRNLAFSFFIGLFFGVFLIDVIHSAQIVAKLKAFADANDVVVRYEALKAHIRKNQEKAAQKYHFFSPFRSLRPINEHLKEMFISREKVRRAGKKRH